MNGPRRLPALLAIVALLVGGGIADRAGRSRASSDGPAPQMAVAPPASALASDWYCPVVVAAPAGAVSGAVIIANPSGRDVKGTVTFVPSDKTPPSQVAIDVKPASRTVIDVGQSTKAAVAAALVELQGGGVVVEHSVSGPLGADVAPCASAASPRWYFADGGTTADARELIALYNPFADNAVVDLTFSTDQGNLAPQALQAVLIPGRTVVSLDLGAYVLRRRAISVSIVARSGRLVAERVQSYNGTAGRKGLADVAATPSPGTLWYFPDGLWSDGLTERYQIYNPTGQEARISLELGLDKGAAEPFDLTVPAGGRITVKSNDESRVPKGIAHSATVTSQNGVGVVVERSIDGAKPATRLGLASVLGARMAARNWVFVAGLVTDKLDEWVIVMNPGPKPTRVSFTVLASGQPLHVDKLQRVLLPAGRRMAVRVGDYVDRVDLGLEVSADQPVVAERDLYRVGSTGISAVVGIPLR